MAIAAVVLVAIGTVAALARSTVERHEVVERIAGENDRQRPEREQHEREQHDRAGTHQPCGCRRRRALGSYPSAPALASAVARSLGTNSTAADALQKLQASPAAQGATAAAPFGAVDNGAAAAGCADEFTTLGGAGGARPRRERRRRGPACTCARVPGSP